MKKEVCLIAWPYNSAAQERKAAEFCFLLATKAVKAMQTQLSACLSGQGDNRSTTGTSTVSKSDNVITDPILGIDRNAPPSVIP